VPLIDSDLRFNIDVIEMITNSKPMLMSGPPCKRVHWRGESLSPRIEWEDIRP